VLVCEAAACELLIEWLMSWEIYDQNLGRFQEAEKEDE